METERNDSFGYNPTSEKEIRSLTILELIRKKGAISRTEISETTRINIVSVSNYVKNFIDKKLVIEKGFDVSSGGRKPELVELNIKGANIIGLDVGEKEIRVVVADLGANVAGKINLPRIETAAKETAAKYTDLIEEVAKTSGVPISNVKCIGIGVDDNRFIAIGKSIERRFGIKVFFGDRTSSAAFGEKRLNPAADVENLLYMYSDVGRGIVIKGNSCIRAPEDNSGSLPSQELKYLRQWDEALGMADSAKSEVSRGVGTKVVSLAKGEAGNITNEMVMEAAVQSDEVASSIVHNVGITLGLRIAYLVNLFKPQAVVIGGGPEKAGELILEPIRKMVTKLALRSQAKDLKIVPGVLGEDAVSLGAVSLAIREMFLRA